MTKKVILIVTILLIVMSAFSNIYAADLNQIYQGNNSQLHNEGGKILGIVEVVGYITAVVMLIIIGIKFVMASPEGKADLKKQLIPFVIGCVILFAGSTIITVIKSLGLFR